MLLMIFNGELVRPVMDPFKDASLEGSSRCRRISIFCSLFERERHIISRQDWVSVIDSALDQNNTLTFNTDSVGRQCATQKSFFSGCSSPKANNISPANSMRAPMKSDEIQWILMRPNGVSNRDCLSALLRQAHTFL